MWVARQSSKVDNISDILQTVRANCIGFTEYKTEGVSWLKNFRQKGLKISAEALSLYRKCFYGEGIYPEYNTAYNNTYYFFVHDMSL